LVKEKAMHGRFLLAILFVLLAAILFTACGGWGGSFGYDGGTAQDGGADTDTGADSG
jgi:predicted small secreted protein